MGLKVCVFCSSSEGLAAKYVDAARRLGQALGEGGHSLVYGGGNVGLMGEVARSTQASGGQVVGVIPEGLRDRELAYVEADELIVTADMRDRKTIMERRSDAFITLPGGFGTLEELLELIALRLLKYHDKPILVVNQDGFYDPLLATFERLFEEGFAKETYRRLYDVVDDVDAALRAVTSAHSA